MKIVSYNLYEGAEATQAELAAFINSEQPDVVCLQEANGWGDDGERRAKEFASETGLPFYVYGDSHTRFKLATFSRVPFARTEVHTTGFWHSAIQAGIPHGGGVTDIWNVHLNPRNETDRLDEARILTSMIDGQRTIITGDLNSLSAADHYGPQAQEQLRAQGIRKFGETALRYDVTDHFAAHGLIDVAEARGTRDWTVPTPANTDPHHAVELRLDYMLMTADLLPLVTHMSVAKNALTDKISDHYPLIATVDVPPQL